MTNRDILAKMDNHFLAHFIVENIMTDCTEEICSCTFQSEKCGKFNNCILGITEWLESEVKE